MVDKYWQSTGSQAIEAMKNRCYAELGGGVQPIFENKFRQLDHDRQQWMHAYRELILGAYLHKQGLRVQYALNLQGKTPDWVIEDDHATPQAIVELVNFHIDQTAEKKIREKKQNRPAVVTLWRDGSKDNQRRLYDRLEDKMLCYRELVSISDLAYIVAVFGTTEAILDADEVLACLEGRESPLFAQHPHVSGVLFFEEINGGYGFQYFENPVGLWKLGIMPGVFSR
jgi:hypothetical protein